MSGSEGIVHLLLGNNTAHVISTAQANQLALALRLNEESVNTKCLDYGNADSSRLQSYENLGQQFSSMRGEVR